ncbi:hypothetical protein PoB_005175700 [Plakobranchus ocellatus]|uniref:Uncharacterized protein n=1 Tax=Plakobranchus ocellatus TaxID=259542 RepID=A0AAV4C1M8_9GAST|nr:hypothetical protein PoB_005175700 [Plakobranchus ocellatus]
MGIKRTLDCRNGDRLSGRECGGKLLNNPRVSRSGPCMTRLGRREPPVLTQPPMSTVTVTNLELARLTFMAPGGRAQRGWLYEGLQSPVPAWQRTLVPFIRTLSWRQQAAFAERVPEAGTVRVEASQDVTVDTVPARAEQGTVESTVAASAEQGLNQTQTES